MSFCELENLSTYAEIGRRWFGGEHVDFADAHDVEPTDLFYVPVCDKGKYIQTAKIFYLNIFVPSLGGKFRLDGMAFMWNVLLHTDTNAIYRDFFFTTT